MTPEQVIRIIREADEVGTQVSIDFDMNAGYNAFVEALVEKFGNEFAKENPGFNREAFDGEFWAD